MPAAPKAVWRQDFSDVEIGKTSGIPASWTIRNKPGTKPAVFRVVQDTGSGHPYLHMESNNASASMITRADGIDLRRTPVLRWRWRATELPDGADGRRKDKDDQAISIYIGTGGNPLSVRTVSYRWDTLTPKGSTGEAKYAGGAVKDKWLTLRNKEDLNGAVWYEETRNVAEDYIKAWGALPKTVYLSLSCNSQYTGTKAKADLDWIEFISTEGHETTGPSVRWSAQNIKDRITDLFRKGREILKKKFGKGREKDDIQ